MINQLSVFLTNDDGRLAALCRVLAEAQVNMKSLLVADTEDFGIVRIICDTPEAAMVAARGAGYRAALTRVIAVEVPNETGSLAKLLEFLDEMGASVEYCYCFISGQDHAVEVLKLDDERYEQDLAKAGFTLVAPESLYLVG